MGPEDLRPISLLPLPGKICEHLIHAQIDSFLERNNLLTKFQNGFRTKRSTALTIFDYLYDLRGDVKIRWGQARTFANGRW